MIKMMEEKENQLKEEFGYNAEMKDIRTSLDIPKLGEIVQYVIIP